VGVGAVFLIVVVGIVAAGLLAFLFLTGAGVELREGRRRRPRRRPVHARVENEQRAVSSPVRSARPDDPEPRPHG